MLHVEGCRQGFHRKISLVRPGYKAGASADDILRLPLSAAWVCGERLGELDPALVLLFRLSPPIANG